MLQRIDAAGGDDPGLAHRATEHVLQQPSAFDELRGTGQDRADRGAQALERSTQTESTYEAKVAAGMPEATAALSNRAPSMEAQTAVVGQRPHLRQALERPDAPPPRLVVFSIEMNAVRAAGAPC